MESFPISQISNGMISNGICEDFILFAIDGSRSSNVTVLFVMSLMETAKFYLLFFDSEPLRRDKFDRNTVPDS